MNEWTCLNVNWAETFVFFDVLYGTVRFLTHFSHAGFIPSQFLSSNEVHLSNKSIVLLFHWSLIWQERMLNFPFCFFFTQHCNINQNSNQIKNKYYQNTITRDLLLQATNFWKYYIILVSYRMILIWCNLKYFKRWVVRSNDSISPPDHMPNSDREFSILKIYHEKYQIMIFY